MSARVPVFLLAAAIGLAAGPAARAVTPSARLASTPAALGLAFEAVTFPSAGDSTALEGWWVPGRRGAPLLVMAGPGRGNRADLLAVARAFHDRGFTVMLFDYRDFGPGGPGPADSLRYVVMASRWVDDALGALRFARARAGPGAHLFGWGHEMGGAVLLAAAARDARALDGLVLDNPFRSTADQMSWDGSAVIGDAPFRQSLLIRPQDEPYSTAIRVRAPLLLMLAGREPGATPEVADKLFVRARARVDRWLVPDATRAALLTTPGYVERIEEWIAAVSRWMR